MKKVLAILLCLSVLLCFMPTAAFAAEDSGQTPASSGGEGETGGQGEAAYVAQIDTVKYATLDEAIAAAADGAEIELLADCETTGMNLSKNLTIDGSKVTAEQATAEDGSEEQTPSEQKGWTITFTDKGIALWGKSLTFKNCDVVMNGIGSTPYTAEWNWQAICASKDASLNLENVAMTMNGTGAGNAHAIYFCSNNKLNLNNSKLEIKNYAQDALEWDGGDGGYNVNLTNSTFISDYNRSGFTGTFIAKAENSKIDVINSTGNGSNGSHFEFINSKVNFNNNGSHGLSAGRLVVDNSTVNANGNGANGIHVANSLKVQNNSVVNIKENQCTISSKWTIPGALYVNAAEASLIDATSTVTITENKGSGILLKSGALTVADDAKLTVTNNEAVKLGYGGGVNVRGQLVLPAGTILYNNHASEMGDDIYCNENAQITFGAVGTNWILDDCSHAIDGWYEDDKDVVTEAEDGTTTTTYNRWNAHDEEKLHISLYTPKNGEAVNGKLALKAAHGKIVPTPIDPPTKYITVSVTKQWVLDDGGKATDSVTVQLMQNGKAYGSPKVLTAANQWTDTWYVPAGYTYTVEELQVPDGFTASVKGSGTSFTIINDDIKADTPEDPEQPTTPDKPTKPTKPEQPTKPEDKTEVPKTGDNSALAGSALLLLLSACGLAAALRRKEEK